MGDTAEPDVNNGQEQALRELTTRLTSLEESHRQLRAGTDQVIDRLRIELRQKREQQS
jgi:two-component sensor histidine kinase